MEELIEINLKKALRNALFAASLATPMAASAQDGKLNFPPGGEVGKINYRDISPKTTNIDTSFADAQTQSPVSTVPQKLRDKLQAKRDFNKDWVLTQRGGGTKAWGKRSELEPTYGTDLGRRVKLK